MFKPELSFIFKFVLIFRSLEARRVSIHVMILILSCSKITGEIPLSQFSESQPLWQISQTQTQTKTNLVNNDNEPLCYEVLSLMKRYFSHQAQVKAQLYLGT